MNGIFAFVDGIRQRQENYTAAIKELLLDIDIQRPLIALCFSVAGFFMSRLTRATT